ncbi:MAG TPA: hypothetical protein VE091_04330 [Gemmatimonadales bacterium]|nr:hypothetical protein [Gemmatimonadales bacterium]
MADARGEMGRQLLRMIALVAAVDAVAIAAWFLAGIRGRSEGVQVLYAIGWTLATLGVVVVSMRKIRDARKSVKSEK